MHQGDYNHDGINIYGDEVATNIYGVAQDKLVFDLRSPNFEPIILIEDLPIAKPLKFLPPIYATINGITRIKVLYWWV